MGGVTLIETEGLSVGYRGRAVASGIDLSLRSSEVLCILGPNGSGKTTLFRTLLGLIPPIGGTMLVEGRALSGLSRRMAARSLAYVPQAETGAFSFTVADLVLMGRTAHLGLFAAPAPQDRLAALAALETVGIGDLAGRDATRISGGQRQLALVARALAQDARIIVMDEPTASLDFGNRLKVLDIVRDLARRGLGIVMSTHEPEQAFAIADRVAIVHDGRLAAFGPPAEALTAGLLSEIYGVAVEIEATQSGRRVVLPRGGA